MNMDLRCSVGELKRKARWFCEVCLHGICIACVRAQREKHKRNVTVTDLEEVVISESSTSPSSSSLYVEIEETEEMSDSLTLEVQLEENGVADEFDVWIEDDGDDFVEVFQAAPDADQEAELEETCLRAESVLVPDYVDGHILLNHYAHVLTRRFRSSLNLKSKRILSSIATSMPGFTSVLNLEGLLFPAIFWSATKTGDVFGGLPVTALAGDLLHEFRL
ncbi:MAG: uncharacterized protein KVP18_004977, partial [Porospora cf. gigantea A]|uniref:uncharacterized protein n=1 Tax=Porospora cf. gigantea A TaxID=2853593 RepID=UPI00355A9865